MNTELRDALLKQYQVRKSAAEKQAFCAYVKQYCEEKGIPYDAEEEKGGTNLVLGNPDTAKLIFTAHYDTCAWMPLPNMILPLNVGLYMAVQTLIVLVMLIPSALLGFAGWHCIGRQAGAAIFALATLATCLQMLYGKANRHTANDNTSGVATILEAAACKPEGVAFVLFDNEETGMKGSRAFAARHRDAAEKTPLVNFDCVSDGDFLMLAVSKQAHDLPCLEEIRKSFCEAVRKMGKRPLDVGAGRAMYNSDQQLFPYGMAVAALKKSRTGLYYLDRIHTNRDTKFDERNIDCCANWVGELSANAKVEAGTAKKLPNANAHKWIAIGIGFIIGIAARILYSYLK